MSSPEIGQKMAKSATGINETARNAEIYDFLSAFFADALHEDGNTRHRMLFVRATRDRLAPWIAEKLSSVIAIPMPGQLTVDQDIATERDIEILDSARLLFIDNDTFEGPITRDMQEKLTGMSPIMYRTRGGIVRPYWCNTTPIIEDDRDFDLSDDFFDGDVRRRMFVLEFDKKRGRYSDNKSVQSFLQHGIEILHAEEGELPSSPNIALQTRDYIRSRRESESE